MTIIARLTQLSLRADFIFYSCENWQIVMSWNSCRARYCSRKSQGQLIQWPAVFGIILTFMLCSINLLVERLCMMHFFFFFSGLVKDSSCVFDSFKLLTKIQMRVFVGHLFVLVSPQALYRTSNSNSKSQFVFLCFALGAFKSKLLI